MWMYAVVCWFFLFLVSVPAHAQEQKEVKELGLDQKLERLYQLYRSGETVSLKSYEMRFGLGIAYALDEETALGIRASSRTLGLQGSFAYGITNWLEAGIAVPLKWNDSRIESSEKSIVHQSIAGIGDVNVRLIANLPIRAFEITPILGISFPTGGESLGESGIQSSLGFNIAKTIRPAFLYMGLAWQRNWHTQRDSIGYTAGFGFYVNHALSVGAELSGTRFLNPPRGGIYDAAVMTLQMSYQATPYLGLTPYVSIGLTDSAPDAVVGANLVWRR